MGNTNRFTVGRSFADKDLDSAKVQGWGCGNIDNQRWYLERVSVTGREIVHEVESLTPTPKTTIQFNQDPDAVYYSIPSGSRKQVHDQSLGSYQYREGSFDCEFAQQPTIRTSIMLRVSVYSLIIQMTPSRPSCVAPLKSGASLSFVRVAS